MAHPVRVKTSEGWQDVTSTVGPPGAVQVFEQAADPGAVAIGSMWIETDIDTDQSQFGLVGAPIPWLVDQVPAGYREFDGSAIVQATHPKLYALFGGTIPDLRGKVLFGQTTGYAIGTVGGADTHTLTLAQMPSHNHAVTMGGPGHSLGTNWNPGTTGVTFGFTPSAVNANAAYNNAPANAEPVGGGAAHNNMPPYRTVRWITVAG